MSKQAMILAGLLGLTLVGSYMTWTSDESAADAEGVVLLDAKVEQLETISWRSESLDVDITRRSDALGDYLWVTTTERKEVEIPVVPDLSAPDPLDALDGSSDEPAPVEPQVTTETQTTVRSFKAGETGQDLLTSLAPLMAERRLDVGPDRHADFGLVDPQATLSVTRTGKEPREIAIGDEAYGTRDRYALDTADGQVVLLDQDLLRPLKFATTRLPDRELLGLETADLTQVVVETPSDAPVALVQVNADDSRKASWGYVVEGEEPAADDTAASWMGKALALKAKGFVQPEDMPLSTSPALTLQVQAEGGEQRVLEILSGQQPDGTEGWYAKSSHTRELVSLHPAQASELVADLEALRQE